MAEPRGITQTMKIPKHGHLRDIAGLVPDTTVKYRNKASVNLFAGGGSCLQFVKNATSFKIIIYLYYLSLINLCIHQEFSALHRVVMTKIHRTDE